MTQQASGEAAPGARAEGDGGEEKAKEGDMPAEPEGAKPTGQCSGCGMANAFTNKFCAECGESMAAPALPEPDDDDDGPESEPAPSSKEGSAAAPAEPAKMAAPKMVNTSASLASILGAPDASDLALRTRAAELRQIADTAAGVTGQTRAGRIVGALLTLPERLVTGERAAADLSAITTATEQRRRRDLAQRYVATGAIKRTMVFDDAVTEDGKRDGAPRIRSAYARMDLDVFTGLVEGLEKSRPATQRKPATPFEPSEAKAKELVASATAAPPPVFDDAAKGRLANHPDVATMRQRGSHLTTTAMVDGLIKTNPRGAAAWLASQNGANA